jgi:hypothetical protein
MGFMLCINIIKLTYQHQFLIVHRHQGSLPARPLATPSDTAIPLTGRPPQQPQQKPQQYPDSVQSRVQSTSHQTPKVSDGAGPGRQFGSGRSTGTVGKGTPPMAHGTPAERMNSSSTSSSARKSRGLHSQQLDRPAHWGGPSSALKPAVGACASGGGSRGRSAMKTQRRPSEVASQPLYSSSFSTLRKQVVPSKAPSSLDRVSFQPSWLRSKTPTSAPAAARHTPRMEDDIDSNWQGRVDDNDGMAFGNYRDREYDRIDDLTNSLDPHGYADGIDSVMPASTRGLHLVGADMDIESDTGRAFATTFSTAATGTPMSLPRPRVLPLVDEFDTTPVKSGKRKLRQYGALLKKVKQAEEGKDSRWLNLHNAGNLHCNTDPVRYDLNDPRCGSSTCMDVCIINAVSNSHFKLHYGMELFLVQVNQIRRRSTNSVIFELLSPQELNLKRRITGIQPGELEAGSSGIIERECQIKPGSHLLGYFRSDTVQFLSMANNQQPLSNLTLRIYDYMVLFPPESEASSLVGVSGSDSLVQDNLPRLLCTRLVELRQQRNDATPPNS